MRYLQMLLLGILLNMPAMVWAQGVVIIEHGDTITPVADITVTSVATLIRAASADRMALSCTNKDTSIAVRWGSSAVTATAGQAIPAGASIEIASIGAVYMVSESTDVSVSCTEELR